MYFKGGSVVYENAHPEPACNNSTVCYCSHQPLLAWTVPRDQTCDSEHSTVPLCLGQRCLPPVLTNATQGEVTGGLKGL